MVRGLQPRLVTPTREQKIFSIPSLNLTQLEPKLIPTNYNVLLKYSSAQISSQVARANSFVGRRLTFVGPQHGVSFM